MLRNSKTRTRLCSLILIGTFWIAPTSSAQPQSPTPLPHLPVQNNTNLSHALTRTPPATLEHAFRQLCGHRFSIETPNVYIFTTHQNNVRRHATLRIDTQTNRVHFSGDPQLCEQLFHLVTAIDLPPPQGKGRQIIPYQHTPMEVLAQAFASFRPDTPPKLPTRPHTETAAAEPAVRRLNPNPSPAGEPIQQVTHQFEGTFDGGVDMLQPSSMFGTQSAIGIPDDFQFMFIPQLDVVVVEAEGGRLQRFTEMIRQLEELSKINRPTVEAVYLKHVNNVSLGVVLTQIYADVFATVPGAVRFIPMTSPNGMLLIGWGEAMDVAKELLTTLDQPTATEHSRLHVFKLQHISALQARNAVQGAFPAPGGLSGFAARLQIFHEPRANALIVQGSPNEIEEVKRIIHTVDVTDTNMRLQMNTIMLKNSLASDVAQTLTNAITGTATDGKIPAFDLLIRGAEGQRLIKSGIMTDVNISTDVRNNQIIIRAPESCMAFIEELINLLDIASPEAAIKIFQIENGDAQSLVAMLTSLIPSNVAGTPGPQLPGSADGDSLIPIRFAVDVRTNCIVAAGSVGDLKTIEALVESLDREDMLNREVTVYPLKNMKAADVADTINEYIRSRLDVQLATPGVIAPFQQIESAVIVVADVASNSLIIGATPRYYDEIIQLVQEIDRSPPQVVIRVLIAEITLSDGRDWAAELGFQDPILFKRGSGFSFNNTNKLPDWNVASETVASQLLTNFGGAARSASGGLVFAASSEYVNIMLQALQENRRLEVLSAPQIATMNNQQALVSVGQIVPRQAGTRRNNNETEVVVVDTPVDLMLTVTPTISPEGTIVMAVRLKKDKVGEMVTFSDNSSASSIDSTHLATMVTAANNQTVILGGLITNEVQRDRRKIPLLGDIPYIGKLFRQESDRNVRKELLVILTPRVVDGKEDLDQIRQIEMARMSWARHNVAKVYGDIESYSVNDERPFTGTVPVIRPGPVKMETLQRIETQPMIAPMLPRR